jgi:beta-lactamase class A
MAQENVLESILKSHPESYKKLMDQAHKYRLQIFYTQIDRNAKNEANFTTYSYRANDQEYVYPASTVKLAASVLALEKLNTLGLNKALTMRTLKNRDSQIEVRQDTSAADGQPSVEHYIKKILLVSDNEAYNRLYEFLGQRDFNETMRKKGFEGVRLTHRLQIPLPRLENQYTNPVEFLDSKNQVVYSQ